MTDLFIGESSVCVSSLSQSYAMMFQASRLVRNNRTIEPQSPCEQKRCVVWAVSDPGVQFVSGLSDVNAVLGGTAEIMCKVSSEDCEGAWFKDNQKVSPEPQTNHKHIDNIQSTV